LGKLFFAQQRLDSALVYFRHAIVLDPNLPEAYNSLGTVLALHGQYAEALTEYRRALEIDPEYQRARDNMQLAREALVGKSN
jgi:tetratricopeptide (TPR) repeat protein